MQNLLAELLLFLGQRVHPLSAVCDRIDGLLKALIHLILYICSFFLLILLVVDAHQERVKLSAKKVLFVFNFVLDCPIFLDLRQVFLEFVL